MSTLFYEPSTRTRLSFERQARMLGAPCGGLASAGPAPPRRLLVPIAAGTD